jgi:hypothetical protein
VSVLRQARRDLLSAVKAPEKLGPRSEVIMNVNPSHFQFRGAPESSLSSGESGPSVTPGFRTPDTSFPFFGIARRTGAPYGQVLRLSDQLQHAGPAEVGPLISGRAQVAGLVIAAMESEDERREAVRARA